MDILLTGDINLRGHDTLSFSQSQAILAQVIPYLNRVDYVIPNLECPLADVRKYTPIKKAGPNLICPENCVSFLKAMNASAVTLANNHIGDYGDGALEDTIRLLDENHIQHVGAGSNIFQAYAPLHITQEGTTVSIFSVCENEFGIADAEKAGSAGYNPRLLMNAIRDERDHSDFIIVVFHGGNEFNPLPSPDTVDRYRFICDMGADAVIAGHTHCPQGYEWYHGKPIVYSMGNFLFPSSKKLHRHNSWYYGYFTILHLSASAISFDIVPYQFDQACTKITVFQNADREKMMDYLCNLSEIIENPTLLKQYFKGWAMNHLWIPNLPSNMDDLSQYNASGNFDLLKCEAHLSQAKQILEILFQDEVSEAKQMEQKILQLQNMPV